MRKDNGAFRDSDFIWSVGPALIKSKILQLGHLATYWLMVIVPETGQNLHLFILQLTTRNLKMLDVTC